MYKQKLDELLSQEVSRYEFIKAAGALLLTLIGLPAIINALSSTITGSEKNKVESKSALGYGNRPYGE